MLTTARALEVAGRHQRAALLDACAYAASLGERVGFLRRAVAGGAHFEAIALDSARACAVVDVHGDLRYLSGERAGETFRRPAPPRFRAHTQRRAEAALVAVARPRDNEAA
jgi:hypothetical protein